MMSLQRWMRKEAEASNPTWMAVLAALSWILLPWLFFFSGMSGQVGLYELLLAAGGLLLSNLPLLVQRSQLPKGALQRARLLEQMVRQPSKFKLGARAENMLEESASDLEQLQVLLARKGIDKDTSSKLIREANQRMCRIFDLCCDAPGKHQLSTDSANEQIRIDMTWLARARSSVEQITTKPVERSQESILVDVEAQAVARQKALEELLEGSA